MNSERAGGAPSDDSSLIGLDRIARFEFDHLTAAYPIQRSRGGTLLLGKHYALRKGGIVMLGINPGGGDDQFYTGRFTFNCLVESDGGKSYRYWQNARTLFTSSAPLKAAMDEATFSFCCPFRTPNWNGQPRELRDALISHSQPILTRIISDCAPRLILIAGVAGEGLFSSLMGTDLEHRGALPGEGDATGTYQWRAYSATIGGRDVTVAQVPHFSRANAAPRLRECGAWLSGLLPA